MGQWLQHALLQFQQFMIGRYGNDELTRFLSIASLVTLVLSFFFSPLYLLSLALIVWSLFRTFSKNIPARINERDRYLQIKSTVAQKCRLYKRMWAERKTHRYFHCRHCHAVIRIPKGKGTVDVGCPRCGTRTTKQS